MKKLLGLYNSIKECLCGLHIERILASIFSGELGADEVVIPEYEGGLAVGRIISRYEKLNRG